MSTPESFADDGGGFFGPHKGCRVRIPLGEVALDVADKGAHRIERPRRTDLRVRMLNHASTMFSHEAPVGVK